jgi:hypothetical protein
MVILPTCSSQDGKSRAQQLLREVASQRAHCTMVVFGDGTRPREIAKRAEQQTKGDPFRGVVDIPDVEVLEGDDTFKPLLAKYNAGAEAIALTTEFRVSS